VVAAIGDVDALADVHAGDPARWAVADTRLALARLSRRLDPRPAIAEVGVHASAVVDESARLGARVAVGPLAVVGAGAVLEDDVVLGAGAVVGAGARVGAGSVLRERVVLEDGVVVGRRCWLQAGAVIGGDGFGYAPGPRGAERIHHLGTVVLGDDVEVGANACIDRATLGATVVGPRSKIDNLVQIGHNVRIGADVLIAGQTGIAGSTVIGDRVVIGGAVGVADHVEIGADARIAGGAGVTKSVPPGDAWGGYPAQPLRRWVRERYLIGRLEAIWAFVKGRA
jgi:UDP-3-O-[3-hydroxymyristoyl] glucosamine N-acyltransferase